MDTKKPTAMLRIVYLINIDVKIYFALLLKIISLKTELYKHRAN